MSKVFDAYYIIESLPIDEQGLALRDDCPLSFKKSNFRSIVDLHEVHILGEQMLW
jgi:hypothetical protein